MALVEELIVDNWLKTPYIIEAFKKIKRVDFLPEEMKNFAELDEALPIGQGQTISQPSVVVFMLEKLEPKPGDKILDVGSGSGYSSALLGEIVGKNGKVISLEIVPGLKESGEENTSKYNFVKQKRVEFILADGSKGYLKEAPFDRILCSASVQKEIPQAWRKQLKVGGKIVAPIGSSIWVLTKKSESNFEEIEYPGFTFVPLITKK
ncbi:MAG: Protein-L-isoaspartate(D-aspartate) O-methyltransferase [Parcubacteria group bacterium GW2011_GWF2_43_11]|nr:MAG: Protein-L-isoaspartate(D-aspartate) O-methyltransferase [Parcubacteria group bacterium GW2011_GWF2_43_11]